jgi:hypothetical protein
VAAFEVDGVARYLFCHQRSALDDDRRWGPLIDRVNAARSVFEYQEK